LILSGRHHRKVAAPDHSSQAVSGAFGRFETASGILVLASVAVSEREAKQIALSSNWIGRYEYVIGHSQGRAKFAGTAAGGGRSGQDNEVSTINEHKYSEKTMNKHAAYVRACVFALFLPYVAPVWGALDEAVQAYQKGDYSAALDEFRKLAEQDLPEARLYLGVMYVKGEGVSQDYSEAVKWFTKAAEQGLAEAQLSLGFMYYGGKGVKQDYAEAAKWFRKAADQGHADAQFSLGIMYEYELGVPLDYREAEKYFSKAAEQGHAEAQFSLGVMYQFGIGVRQNYVKAHMWYSIAAANDFEEGAQNRDAVAEEMNPGQIAAANKQADLWIEKHR
jgi:Flp pilus assembly protein TadD